MFGVLLVNLMVFTGDAGAGTAVTDLDQILAWTRDTAFNGKSYLVLAMVFGYSLGLQMRVVGTVPERRRALTRRLVALAFLGVLHGLLLYRYDILFAYGVLGYIAYLLRRHSTKTLLALCAGLTVAGSWALLRSIDTRGFARFGPAVAVERYRNGSIFDLIELHIRNHLANVTGEMIRQWPFAFTAILLGVLAERHDVVSSLKSPGPLRFILGLTGVIGGTVLVLTSLPGERSFGVVMNVVSPVSPLAFAIGVTTGVAALMNMHSWPARVFSSIGRMSLTVYLTQSIVCTTVLYGFGFGLARLFRPTVQLFFTVALFSVQAVLCHLWMQRYRRGPVEALVRRWAGTPSRPTTR